MAFRQLPAQALAGGWQWRRCRPASQDVAELRREVQAGCRADFE
jgi:hypothetical protein